MVEKISFTPEEIRGYGNIVSVHSLDDYECYDGILTETTDTIDGATVTVYEMEYQTDTEATTCSLTASSQSFVVGGSVTFTATLLDNELSGVSGVTITFKDGTTTLGTGTTNSSGVATYTTSSLASGSHSITAVFAGNSSYTASTSSAVSVTVLSHNYHLEFGSNSYTTDLNGDVTITCTLTDNSVAVSSASVSLTGTGVSTSATTDSDGLATFNLTGLSTDTTLTASYSGTTATCTVIYETFGFEDDFSSGLSDKWVTFGATPTTSVSGGVLTLSKNGNRGGIYYDKLITGDYKVTVSVQSGTYDSYAVGLNTTTGGWNYYELQPKFSYGYFFIDSSGNTTESHYSRQSASYSSATLVFEVIKDTSIKAYVNGTLKATYTVQDTTTDGYVGIVQCCNRNTKINSIKVEALQETEYETFQQT